MSRVTGKAKPPKLLGCPFCGAKATLMRGYFTYTIYCGRSGRAHGASAQGRTQAHAIKRWNRRAKP